MVDVVPGHRGPCRNTLSPMLAALLDASAREALNKFVWPGSLFTYGLASQSVASKFSFGDCFPTDGPFIDAEVSTPRLPCVRHLG